MDLPISKPLLLCMAVILGTGSNIITLRAQSQSLYEKPTHSALVNQQKNREFNQDSYILGPGDVLEIELFDLPGLTGLYAIGPDGTIYMPRLRAVHVEGLTIEEVRSLLTQEFSTYVRNPQVYIRPHQYRPIRVYVGGEVVRPGYYTISGVQDLFKEIDIEEKDDNVNFSNPGNGNLFPTLFDAIRSAQGVTPYSNLSEVKVVRKIGRSAGGGKKQTILNFLSVITEGNQSQNIRLYDGDTVDIAKSDVIMKDRLTKATQSNLSSQFIQIYVTGSVNNPGQITAPQGSSLNQAIILAGGTLPMHGRVEFISFDTNGSIDRRIFSYEPESPSNNQKNPILKSGDIIRVQDSMLGTGTKILNEVTSPFVGIYSVYSLFQGFSK